jgi:hypothetical protein
MGPANMLTCKQTPSLKHTQCPSDDQLLWLQLLL